MHNRKPDPVRSVSTQSGNSCRLLYQKEARLVSGEKGWVKGVVSLAIICDMENWKTLMYRLA